MRRDLSRRQTEILAFLRRHYRLRAIEPLVWTRFDGRSWRGLIRRGLVMRDGTGFRLTDRGREG